MDYRYPHKKHDGLLILNVILGVILGGGALFLLEVTAWKLYCNPYRNVQKIVDAKLKNNSSLTAATLRRREFKQLKMDLGKKRGLKEFMEKIEEAGKN